MTRKFVVIKPFTDLQDNGHVYEAGDFYPREGLELDEARAEELESGNNKRKEKLIVEVIVKEELKVAKESKKKSGTKKAAKTKEKK